MLGVMWVVSVWATLYCFEKGLTNDFLQHQNPLVNSSYALIQRHNIQDNATGGMLRSDRHPSCGRWEDTSTPASRRLTLFDDQSQRSRGRV